MKPSTALSGIEYFFNAKSIAVAGVSTDPTKVASIIFSNLSGRSEKGLLKASVYAVNPKYDSIDGRHCYPDVASLPEVPELLVVAIPVELTLEVVRQACEIGVKAIVIITGGFGEAGRKDLEVEISDVAAKHGVRVLGPNTIGLLDTYSGVDTLFLPTTKKLPSGREVVSLQPPLKGGVVIVTQSGHLGEIIAEELRANRVGVRALVGVGNQLDVSIEDIVEHFADDPETRVMAVYLEGLKDGRKFLRKASAASRKKPIVVFKLGKTQAGAKAALTHTASMVGDYEVYRAAFKQAGLLEANTLEDLVDYCIAFSLMPESKGRRTLIITNAGGTGAIAADESERIGLDVKPLSGRIVDGMKDRFGDSSFINIVTMNNPLDLTATATTEEFVSVSEFLVTSPEYDMMMVVPTHQPPTVEYTIVDSMAKVAGKAGKPICVCVMGTSELAEMLHLEFLNKGVPSYPSPERAVRALWAVAQYHEMRAETAPFMPLRSEDRVKWIGETRGFLSEPGASRLLAEYGVPTARSLIVKSEGGLSGASSSLGFPVACKLLSKDVIHKTEKGGVILDIKDEASLSAAFRELEKIASESDVAFEGALVQEMVRDGVELILGSMRDRTFGPTVVFGLGGIHTELMKDYATAVAPVSREQALKMMSSIRMRPLLEGYRKGVNVDKDELARIISDFSQMLVDNPSVEEAEINPLIATADRIVAVDARIMLRKA